jgi:outer membrane protein assembly factor BamB
MALKNLLISLLLPPVGIVLLWLRPRPSGLTRQVASVVGRLAGSAGLLVLSLVYAVLLGLVHVEMAGGWAPIFSLHNPKSDQAALDRHRLEQKAASPTPTNVSVADEVELRDDRIVSIAPRTAIGAAWTDFRGPNRSGNYTETKILTDWPTEGLKPLWRQPIGGGYASFVIANGQAFTIEQRREREVVTAYDLRTGRELWTYGWKGLFSETMGGDGPRATPVWHEGLVYALGASGEFHVLEAATGKRVWSTNILTDNSAANLEWGMSNSPLILDDKVIVTPGGNSGRSIVAYDKQTGKYRWGTLDDNAAYTSPMEVTLAGQRQILAVTDKRIVGLAVDDGKLLWDFPWITQSGINSAQPIITDGNHVFVSAGYDHGSVLLNISKTGGRFVATPVWESKTMKNRFNSSVLFDGHIYGFDEGIFACIDARTGERKWKGGRYGHGQAMLAGDHVLVLTESGDLVLIRATPESHQEVARSPAIEGKTWNHPAAAGGILLIRNAREMAAFRINP